jgi:hypothetical protein
MPPGGANPGRTPEGRSPADFEGTGMIYAGVRWVASECSRRGFGECRSDANYAPDVPIAAGSGHRGVTSYKIRALAAEGVKSTRSLVRSRHLFHQSCPEVEQRDQKSGPPPLSAPPAVFRKRNHRREETEECPRLSPHLTESQFWRGRRSQSQYMREDRRVQCPCNVAEVV